MRDGRDTMTRALRGAVLIGVGVLAGCAESPAPKVGDPLAASSVRVPFDTAVAFESGPEGGPAALPDPAHPSEWKLDRAEEGMLDVIAVSPSGRPWIAGRMGMLEHRADDGSWRREDLGTLLDRFAEPRGEWAQILFEGEDVWLVGALGFYHG